MNESERWQKRIEAKTAMKNERLMWWKSWIIVANGYCIRLLYQIWFWDSLPSFFLSSKSKIIDTTCTYMFSCKFRAFTKSTIYLRKYFQTLNFWIFVPTFHTMMHRRTTLTWESLNEFEVSFQFISQNNWILKSTQCFHSHSNWTLTVL